MMPLAMANLGDISIIKKINGNDEIKRFLENLGFAIYWDNYTFIAKRQKGVKHE